jgi:hypothetical protein
MNQILIHYLIKKNLREIYLKEKIQPFILLILKMALGFVLVILPR